MVGVGKGAPGDPERIVKGNAVPHQQPDQLWNRHDRVRIIELHGVFRGKVRIIPSVTGAVGAQQVLHRGADQHILLLDAQLTPFPLAVVGIKEFHNVLRPVLVRGGGGVLLLVEQGKINFVQAFRLPQAQRAHVLGPVAHHRHIVRHRQHIARFHFHHHSLIQPPDGPGIAVAGPVVRLLLLGAVLETLPEQAVAVAQAVAGQGNIVGHGAVHKASGQAAQAAVAEGVVLNILQDRQVDALFRQQTAAFLQHVHAEQVVVHQAAHQEFGAQVVNLLGALFLAGVAGIAAALHNFIAHHQGQGLVQLLRRGVRHVAGELRVQLVQYAFLDLRNGHAFKLHKNTSESQGKRIQFNRHYNTLRTVAQRIAC